MTKRIVSSKPVSSDMIDVSKLSKEDLVKLLGEKYTIAPKVDDAKLTVTVGEYKGKPTISILKGQESFVNRPLTLGVTKARLVLEALDELKAFVKTNVAK